MGNEFQKAAQEAVQEAAKEAGLDFPSSSGLAQMQKMKEQLDEMMKTDESRSALVEKSSIKRKRKMQKDLLAKLRDPNLLEEIKMSDADLLNVFLAKVPTLNDVDPDVDATPIMTCAVLGRMELLKQMLEMGANVETRNQTGLTALMLAAMSGKDDVVELLMSKGAKINARDNDGRTALIFAVAGSSEGVARILIEKDADINVRTNKGDEAIIVAAHEGLTDVIRLLIRKGQKLIPRI